MFNMAGEVIGVVSHIISKSGGSEGLGFVVTMNTARELLLQRRAFWSGLELYQITGPLADALNLPPTANGLLIKSVSSRGQCARDDRTRAMSRSVTRCPIVSISRWPSEGASVMTADRGLDRLARRRGIASDRVPSA
jgi:hypothetical protein